MSSPAIGIGFLMLVVILGAIGVSIVAAIVRWRDRVRRPCCGECRYPVEGLTTFTCPECGKDLREAGILVPGVRPRHRIHVAELLAAWSATVVLLCMISIAVLAGTPFGRSAQFSRGTTLMPASGAIGLISVEATGVASGDASVTTAKAARMTLQGMQSNAPAPPRLEVDLQRGTWMLLPAAGVAVDQAVRSGGLPISDADVGAWVAAASLSQNADAPVAEVAALTEYINSGGTNKDPALNVAMRSSWMRPMPAGWVVWCNLAAWVVIFAVGSWMIVLANRRRVARNPGATAGRAGRGATPGG